MASETKKSGKPVVGIVMGSDTDLPVMSETAKMLEKFEVPYEIEVTSAHRSPARTHEYASTAVSRGLKVVIVAAGGGASCGRYRSGHDASGCCGTHGDHSAFRHPFVAFERPDAWRSPRGGNGHRQARRD